MAIDVSKEVNREFRRSLVEREMHFHDRFQFELKSEFFPDPKHGRTTYSQEFYLFLPTSMRVNPDTYSKQQFYQDQTEVIREKVPDLDLEQLAEESSSPLRHVAKILQQPYSEERKGVAISELKMFGNIYRGAVRSRIHDIVEALAGRVTQRLQRAITHNVNELISQMSRVKEQFGNLAQKVREENDWRSCGLEEHFNYIGQFMNHASDQYLTGLLKFIRDETKHKHFKYLHSSDKKISMLLTEIDPYRYDSSKMSDNPDADQTSDELFQYERGLLNRYVVDALVLDVERHQVVARYAQSIGALAAGLAMFVYMLLFVVNSNFLVINSTPFILASIVLYVLKDQIKDGVKILWQNLAGSYLPDFRTEIHHPEGGSKNLGELREYFQFIDNSKLPIDIIEKRQKGQNRVLEAFERPEVVLYARKHLVFYGDHPILTIFRFSIQRFLEKISDPDKGYTTLDQATGKLVRLNLPKVYHLNVVMKSKVIQKSGDTEIQLRKFRVILDKLGIKRIERVS